jgi:hypothetical protein
MLVPLRTVAGIKSRTEDANLGFSKISLLWEESITRGWRLRRVWAEWPGGLLDFDFHDTQVAGRHSR